jgi:hypothetical protein
MPIVLAAVQTAECVHISGFILHNRVCKVLNQTKDRKGESLPAPTAEAAKLNAGCGAESSGFAANQRMMDSTGSPTSR